MLKNIGEPGKTHRVNDIDSYTMVEIMNLNWLPIIAMASCTCMYIHITCSMVARTKFLLLRCHSWCCDKFTTPTYTHVHWKLEKAVIHPLIVHSHFNCEHNNLGNSCTIIINNFTRCYCTKYYRFGCKIGAIHYYSTLINPSSRPPKACSRNIIILLVV